MYCQTFRYEHFRRVYVITDSKEMMTLPMLYFHPIIIPIIFVLGALHSNYVLIILEKYSNLPNILHTNCVVSLSSHHVLVNVVISISARIVNGTVTVFVSIAFIFMLLWISTLYLEFIWLSFYPAA